MKLNKEIAVLAPVPEEYLLEGRAVCKRAGKVAFGSCAWEVFRELDRLRDGAPVEVLIYPSHPVAGPTHRHEVAWRGTYLGHVESRGGAHPEGLTYRPPSVAQHRAEQHGRWALYWEVRDLRPIPLPERLRISALHGHATGHQYAPEFIPEGPLIVTHPHSAGAAR